MVAYFYIKFYFQQGNSEKNCVSLVSNTVQCTPEYFLMRISRYPYLYLGRNYSIATKVRTYVGTYTMCQKPQETNEGNVMCLLHGIILTDERLIFE